MANIASSAVALRIFFELKPVVAVAEKISAVNDILSGVVGFEELYWGNNIDALFQLEILLTWSSPNSLDSFQSSPEQAAVDKILQDMSATAPTTHCLSFKPSANLLCASITDLLLLYNTNPRTTAESFKILVSIIKHTPGCLGVDIGSAVEDEDEDEIGNAFLFVIGWESLAEAEAMKSLHRIEGAELKLCHVRFQKAGD